MLCDLCIIQLNVSYQFKTLAVEVDGKHQQYLIENGVHHSPNSDNSTVHSSEQRPLERTSTAMRPLTYPVSLSNLQHRRLIKSEPTDYEIMSDITIDTNTDLLEDFPRNGVNSSASNQPFGTSNMVCVSDLDLLRSNGDSDNEFINNCLPSSFRHLETPANTLATTVESHQSTTTTTTTTTIASKQLVIAASKAANQNNQSSDRNKSHASKNDGKQLEASGQVNGVSKRKRKPRVTFVEGAVKKSLRPKLNGNIDYSLVRKRRKLINPVNKVRQKIKEENDQTKQSSGKGAPNVSGERAVNPRNSIILRNKRRTNIIEEKSHFQFRRGQHAINRERLRESLNVGRRLIIKETDRFKFAAAIKTIDRVTSARN